jgi:proteasome accessory factor C
VRRLLVMLPWLMERGEVPVAEAVARFGISEADLVRDLELVAMCGLPPFVDEMIDVFIDEGTIFTGIPRVFTSPLRLTAPEGFALLASARAATQLPGMDAGGALGRALAKLEALLVAQGGSADAADGAVVVDDAAPPLLAPLHQATAAHEVIEIDYRGAGDDEARTRTVTPQLVFDDRGFWYLLADDEGGAERTFRVDRIAAVRPTGRRGSARSVTAPTEHGWFHAAELPSVTLRVDADAWPSVERLPLQTAVQQPDGSWLVTLVVTSQAWLARLLVQLGRRATVRSPEQWAGIGAAAASRILQRYQQ